MNLKAHLSANGIQKLIDGVKQYRQDLHTKAELLVANLAAEGANYARSECPIQTGELYSGIVDEVQGTKAFIRVKCPYAVYVEMGTGIRGKNAPHPDKSVIGLILSMTAIITARAVGGILRTLPTRTPQNTRQRTVQCTRGRRVCRQDRLCTTRHNT